MTEMVERVARALWDLDQSRTASRPVFFTDINATMFGNEWSGRKVPWEHVVGPHVVASVADEWREAARAALAAMREPPRGQRVINALIAYKHDQKAIRGFVDDDEYNYAARAWTNAIDAALGAKS